MAAASTAAAMPGLIDAPVKLEQEEKKPADSGLAYEVPKLPEPPAFKPSPEEFRDPLKYLASIRAEAEKYGTIKVIPPPDWKCPFTIKDRAADFQFNTCVQPINQLRRRDGPSAKFMRRLRRFHQQQDSFLPTQLPVVDGVQVDLYTLYRAIEDRGGFAAVDAARRWGEVCGELRLAKGTSNCAKLREVFQLHLEAYTAALAKGMELDDAGEEQQGFVRVRKRFARMAAAAGNAGEEGDQMEAEGAGFGFEEGGLYTFDTFAAKANQFKSKFFAHKQNAEVSDEELEKEYWRVVDGGDLMLRVEYGNDLDVSSHGSGFPRAEDDPPEMKAWMEHPWNLNNIATLDESLLRYVSPNGEISGVSAPWVYVGMVFSTFCWHNEDNYLYSINYLHHGAAKTWYGVSGAEAPMLEEAFLSEVPELLRADPKLLFKLCTMITPRVLINKGVNVYKTVQRPGEFIVTFPKSYHAGFSHGFNCSEAVNFALPDWLPFGRDSIHRYKSCKRSPVFSHERLTITLAHEKFSSPWLEDELRWVFGKEIEERRALVVGDHHPAMHRVQAYRIPPAKGEDGGAKWVGAVPESDVPQCHHCLHYLYLSGLIDKRNPKKLSCLGKECVSKLLDGKDPAALAGHLAIAYRFSLEELNAYLPAAQQDLHTARAIDSYFPVLPPEQSAILSVWFLGRTSSSPRAEPVVKAENGTANGSAANGAVNGGAKTAAGSNGTSQNGHASGTKPLAKAASASVPGNLYFGFCEEFIRVLQKLAGTRTEAEGDAKGPKMIAKLEVDEATGRPKTPIQVGRACTIEEVGDVVVKEGWRDHKGDFYWPKGFRSTRMFPSMTKEGTCRYTCEVAEGEAGAPLFKVTCADDAASPLSAASPAECWAEVMARVNLQRAAKRPRLS